MKYTHYNSQWYQDGIKANPREITANVYLNNHEVPSTKIKSFKIDSTPVNGKWFGFSYAQQLNVTFIDPTKSLTINRGDKIKVVLNCIYNTGHSKYLLPVSYPTYYVDSANRDEKTGDLSATGFDIMAKANDIEFTVKDPPEEDGWEGTYANLIARCASLMGVVSPGSGRPTYGIVGAESAVPHYEVPGVSSDYIWYWRYKNSPGSSENPLTTLNVPDKGLSVRDMITYIAEANGRFAYINGDDQLIFRMIPEERNLQAITNVNFIDAEERIDKSRYFEFNSDAPCYLKGITHTNEAGDTYPVIDEEMPNGFIQPLFDNPLLSLIDDEDKDILLNLILDNIYRSVTPFVLTWRGDMNCEIGDTLWIAQKENSSSSNTWTSNTPNIIRNCFYLSETLEYNGGLRGTSEWQFKEEPPATVAGPTNISTSNKTTRFIVDKANGEITSLVETLGPSGTAWGPTGYARSIINQTATSVSSTVATNKVDELMGPSGVYGQEIAQMQSTITQHTDEIALVVTATGPSGNVVNTASITTAINNSGSDVSINADKINMTGTVRFLQPHDDITELENNAGYITGSALTDYVTDSQLAWTMGPTGVTQIDGGRISTGTISANRINTNGLAAQEIITTTAQSYDHNYGGYVGPFLYDQDNKKGLLLSTKIDGGFGNTDIQIQQDNMSIRANENINIDVTVPAMGGAVYIGASQGPTGTYKVALGTDNPSALISDRKVVAEDMGIEDADIFQANIGGSTIIGDICLDTSSSPWLFGTSFPTSGLKEGMLFYKIGSPGSGSGRLCIYHNNEWYGETM